MADVHEYLQKFFFANCVIGEWNMKNAMFSVFYEVRARYHCLFKQGFGPLRKVLEYEDQWYLELYLLKLKTQEKVIEGKQYNHTSSSTKNNDNPMDHDLTTLVIDT